MSSTLTIKAKSQSSFLHQYQLERKFLVLADKRRGSAALKAGVDKDDVSVLIKIWPRSPDNDDSDLRDIWRNEIRQLHRLAGHPDASDYIAELRTTHEDEFGFYLVLNPGQRRPLDKFFGERDASNRRAVPKSMRDRRLLWANLRRIALGLEVLHSQGLLHRNLTTWSVLTSGEDEIDFQLTGFEWSMRLVSSDNQAGLYKSGIKLTTIHSFIRDWQDFGHLAVQLLNIGQKITNRAIANHEVIEGVSADEIKFIRQLLQVTPLELVDGSFVVARIDEILLAVEAQASNKEPRFHVVLGLGPQTQLGRKIREASGGDVEIDDIAAQKLFVEADLFSPTLISEKVRNQAHQFNLILRGQHLSYYLIDYTSGPEKTPSNWDAAACIRAEGAMPLSHNIIQSVSISFQALNLMTTTEMRSGSHRIRERFTSWQELRRRLKPETEGASREKQLCKAFALMQMLEYLFSAAELFPVQIVAQPPSKEIDNNPANTLVLRSRADENRDSMSQALGLRGVLAVRLGLVLQEDRTEHDGSRTPNWILTDSSILGGRSSTSTEWKFQSAVTNENGETQYFFTGDRLVPDIEDAFLISDDSVGTHEQFLRRMRSFKALADHGELSRMLIDPRYRILCNDEQIYESLEFLELDDSKQQIFKAIVETLPLFLVQGPPGVGKTRLVKELVRSSLVADNSSRLLLSAQSNHAVDHLLHEIEDIGATCGDSGPLIIRCRARERKDETSPFDIGKQSKRLIKDLVESDLYKKASPHIKAQIDSLGESYGMDLTEEKWISLPQSSKSSRRALEGLVLRAANLVFATTNSGELVRLIEEKGQFDWSIIEEAGKATGGELISPLLLSHRRLMIGDHKQLPPFGAERILALLEKPKTVRGALQRGDAMIGRIFRDSTVDAIFADLEVADTAAGEQSFADLCNEATRMFSLFETIIEDEFDRQDRKRPGRPIAMPLIAQHRMHPAIAQIVSNAFYGKLLVTDSVQETKFCTTRSPISTKDQAKIPDTPIVWIDMPWVQNTMNMKSGEIQPRYTNDMEMTAVESVLKLLSAVPGNKKPSLAILSPYSRQVSKLNRLTEVGGHLHTILDQQFSRAAKQKSYCSTVDSFQGSEADCIIISLVRNNHLGSVSAALGFLADARRMNVLLSRARWKLIVIGSLDFLKSISKSPKSAGDDIRIKFLALLLNDVDPTIKNDDISIIKYARLTGGEK